ncbi:amidohydrolase family protein [Fusarium flagelliforme]|uniref:6-methylsalicylate decarboxylase n=1 Tax=Fusarium flagelliforme TaxID=2675880 RepID=A0A395MSF3_9HYPO|nr:amidohydrolase family protein [Fusarium flagelliforme]
MSQIPRIDVHHHIIPPQIQGVAAGLQGMEVPEWTVESDTAFNKTYNIGSAIYSASTPGVTHIADPEESARVARQMNEYNAQLRDENPRNGFFATVPSLQHTDLVLQELRYAFDTLKADGVTLFTSYATPEGYLGHPEYVPVWEELNRRKAVVFVHPINNVSAVYFDQQLPMPAFDWPHETGRTAIDMILNRRLQQFPDVKIILSHGGGTLIALIQRATMIALPEFGETMSAEDMISQAKQFYFDTALAGSKEVFPTILEFAKPGHLLFGSDYPDAPEQLSKGFTKFVDDFQMDNEKRRRFITRLPWNCFPD